jgi:hypothetical protein
MPHKTADPLNVNARLYKQLGRLLDDMEAADRDDTMTFPQRIAALIAVGRVQKIFVDLRKGDLLDGTAGSAVRKYSEAFARPHAARGGKANSRSSTVVQFDNGNDDGDDAG